MLVCTQLDENQQVEVFNSSKLAENRQNSARVFRVFINGEKKIDIVVVVVLAAGNIGNYRCRFSCLKRNEDTCC